MKSLIKNEAPEFTFTDDSIEHFSDRTVLINGKKVIPWIIYQRENSMEVDERLPPIPYTSYYVYLYSEILAPVYYTDIFQLLRCAKKGDEFRFFINSPGGDLNTVCAFGSAIEHTPASIYTFVDGEASSAAFCLTFMGDEIVFSDFAQLMCHNVNYGINPSDMSSIKKYLKNTTITYRKILEKYCSKILSSEEIESIIDGNELHYSAEECRERLEEYKKKQKEKEEQKEE